MRSAEPASPTGRRRGAEMHVRLGINTCFAVKRWPRPEDWVPVVRDRLGLRLVQHSFDLVPAGSSPADAGAIGELRRRRRPRGPLDVHRARRLLGEPAPGPRSGQSGSGARVVRLGDRLDGRLGRASHGRARRSVQRPGLGRSRCAAPSAGRTFNGRSIDWHGGLAWPGSSTSWSRTWPLPASRRRWRWSGIS